MLASSTRFVLCACAVLGGSDPARCEGCLDLAMVLAMDTSASIDAREYALETAGLAQALRSDEVVEAFQSAGRVSVAVLFWADPEMPVVTTAWVEMTGRTAAERLADTVERTPRAITGQTGLARGLAAGLDRLNAPSICATRRVLNVSGDGMDSADARAAGGGWAVRPVRDRAAVSNVTLNALAIADGDPGLAPYFTLNVIEGPDAFVMEIRGYEDFGEAMRLKLLREIGPMLTERGYPPVTIPTAAQALRSSTSEEMPFEH